MSRTDSLHDTKRHYWLRLSFANCESKYQRTVRVRNNSSEAAFQGRAHPASSSSAALLDWNSDVAISTEGMLSKVSWEECTGESSKLKR